MSERKHIDRLFQEKFKDFEATPREQAWKNISSRLHEKKQRSQLDPLWYKLAGVAALIALLMNFTNGFFKSSETHSVQTASVNNTNENFGEFTLASQQYTSNMIQSSIMLQALIQQTLKKNKKEQVAALSKKRETAEKKIYNISAPSSIQLPETEEIENATAVISSQPETENSKKLRDLPLQNPDKDETSITENQDSEKRIKVSTMAAPIYYDNLGNGSAIDAQFANSSSQGQVTMSYGINFAYRISEKIRIRSGISKVGMSYNTNDIAFTTVPNAAALSGIDYAAKVPQYKIESRNVGKFSNLQASTEFNRASLAAPASGFLNQKLGFIEVPLEIEYVIIDKKIGVNLIGGGSTLFLDENSISLNSDTFSTRLGQANNLNNISFTTNLGIGIDYNITPHFQLNVEPTFKYQLNTFSSSTGTLNPYYFGVYSGFSFKF